MLKLIIGIKGTGKTKTLINLVNGALEVTNVVAYSNLSVDKVTGGFNIEARFTNVYTPTGTANVTVNIQKKDCGALRYKELLKVVKGGGIING